MELILRGSREVFRHLAVVLLAIIFSLALYQIWDLETRWFAITAGAIAMVSVSMCMVAVFADFVFIVFMFCIPLWSFNKYFWPTRYTGASLGDLVYGGMCGLGLLDFVLVGLYMSWFFRIFISREQELPRLYLIDLLIGCFLLVHLLSIIGSSEPSLGFHAIEYLLKYVMLYFYVSRNLRPEHLSWVVAAFCFAIIFEAALGAYQHFTGKWLGIALDKGAGSSTLDYQYTVPGLETKKRATGMSYDSHAYGCFVAMILPFPLVLYLMPRIKGELRIAYAIVAVLAVFVVIISFSRSAWLGSAIALVIGIIVLTSVWREGQIVPALGVCLALALLSLPWSASYIYDRFVDSPIGTLTVRFEEYQFALSLLQMYPIFGVGPGNYFLALKQHDYLWQDELPVHNVLLWIASETGILGVGLYVSIVVSAMRRLLAFCRKRRDFVARLAMAAFIGLLTLILDGLTEPLFREPSTFTLFWLLIAMSVALPRFGLPAKNAATVTQAS